MMAHILQSRQAVRPLRIVAASAMLTLGFLSLSGPGIGIVRGDPLAKACSGKVPVLGNACGPTRSCASTNCISWFTATNLPLQKLTGGLPSDNWLAPTDDTNLVSCGMGGDCYMDDEGDCQSFAAQTIFTPLIRKGPSCFISADSNTSRSMPHGFERLAPIDPCRT